MGDFGVSGAFSKMADGEEKVATDTSLVVDEILQNVSLYMPLALLAVTFLYTPELSSAGAVQCFHDQAQGWTEFLYINNYCWESLQAYSTPGGFKTPKVTENYKNQIINLQANNSLPVELDAVKSTNLNYHRAFVLVILVVIFIGLFPSIVWSVIDFDRKIKVQADYLEMGIEEALQVVMRQMVSLVKAEDESDENEGESGFSVKTRLQNHLKYLEENSGSPDVENPFSNTEVKFECFTKLMKNKANQKKLIWQYYFKRVLTMALLSGVSYGLWFLYVQQE